jgi:hypothetical protein
VYGGGVSVYIGGYSSFYATPYSNSIISETFVRNVSVTLNAARFTACSASTSNSIFGANAAYGGSFSLYIGAYAYSYSYGSTSSSSVSTSGLTSVSGVSMIVNNVTALNSTALTLSQDQSFGANAYGGSMSVFHVGAYVWSYSETDDTLDSSSGNATSVSTSGPTAVSSVSLIVNNVTISNSLALTRSYGFSYSANSYGGSISLCHVGAYAWSYSSSSSNSTCGPTFVSGVNIFVSGVLSSKSSASSSSERQTSQESPSVTVGASSYGGSMSVLYVGGYSWSYTTNVDSKNAISACAETSATILNISVSNSSCTDCAANTTSDGTAHDANSYGGSISVAYIGAHAYSYGIGLSSSSEVGSTIVSGVRIVTANLIFSNSRSASVFNEVSHGANAYGGSMSVLYVGAYAWSFGVAISVSTSGPTTLSSVSIIVSNVRSSNSQALTETFIFSNYYKMDKGKAFGADSFGGSMSILHIGSYSWSSCLDVEERTIGDSRSTGKTTGVNDVIVSVSNCSCFNCSASTFTGESSSMANSYGGSTSVIHVGAFAFSYSPLNSLSTCGKTTAHNVSVSVTNFPCNNCIALSTSSKDAFGVNTFGGFLSVLHVGAYSWSSTGLEGNNSESSCEMTNASGFRVSVIEVSCYNCSAVRESGDGQGSAASSYGGSTSIVFVGAYAFTKSNRISRSNCDDTLVHEVKVIVNNFQCSKCYAMTISDGHSFAASAFGGSLSVMYVGAQALSQATTSFSGSGCELTTASDLSVSVVNISCSDCAAVTKTSKDLHAANSIGGSMNVIYIGAVSWVLIEERDSESASKCGATSVSGVAIFVTNMSTSNVLAHTRSADKSFGANSYGGSMSVLYVGSFSWSSGLDSRTSTRSANGLTSASNISINIRDMLCSNNTAMTESNSESQGANSYGGSINAVYIGSYAYSYTLGGLDNEIGKHSSSALCLFTRVDGLLLSISNITIEQASAVSG